MQRKRPSLSLFVAGVLCAGVGSDAFANAALAKKNECLGCHAAATRLVGPSYREVAARYAGQADAKQRIVESIRNGSTGQWGDLQMPPHPKLSNAEADRLATWILGGAK